MASQGVMGKAGPIAAALEAGARKPLGAAFRPCYPRPRKDGVKAVGAAAGEKLCTAMHIKADRIAHVYPNAAGGTIS